MKKKTILSAKKNDIQTRDSVDEWVENKEKKDNEDEPMKRLTIDIPESLHRQLKIFCAIHGKKMSEQTRDLLEDYFREKK
jgi:hypothetical protein